MGILPGGHFDGVHLGKKMGTSNAAVIEAVSSLEALPTTKRQHRSPELKLKIVQETLAPSASMARVARAHGVNANRLFNWRRLYR